MASLTNDPNGTRRIQVLVAGVRRTIRLGTMTRKQAEKFCGHVEELARGVIGAGAASDETVRWLAELDPKYRARLEQAKLVKPLERSIRTLEELTTAYLASVKVKPTTLVTYKQTVASLIAHLGKGRDLSSITGLDAERWKQAMEKEGLAPATISKRVKTGRVIFGRGMKWKVIAENPFDGIRTAGERNPARLRFITRDVADKVIAACPNAEWRLIFALSRYGGLRCPSEHLALKWEDVNWELGRITVDAPKTGTRVFPIFPELRTALREVFEAAPEGTIHVITQYRDQKQNLRSQLQRIIRRAGVIAWPRLFQNLRATRQTELVETFPAHVVCSWIGNSEKVAMAHYLQVRDEHFEAAQKASHSDAISHSPKSSDVVIEPAPDTTEPASGLGKRVLDDPDGKRTTTLSRPESGTSLKTASDPASLLADYERMSLAAAILRSQRQFLRYLAKATAQSRRSL